MMRLMAQACAVPPGEVTAEEALELADAFARPSPAERRRLATLYRKSGVAKRHVAWLPRRDAGSPPDLDDGPFRPSRGPDDAGPSTADRMARYEALAPPLAAQAAAGALDRAELDPAAVTHLVTVSCTGFAAPGVDLELVRRLGLSRRAERVQVGFMGCHGALNGLRTARGLVAAHPQARVVLAVVELCSLHLQYGTDRQLTTANALFADGAAACVLGADGDGWRLRATGSCVFEDYADAMTWRVRDNGFVMSLDPGVPRAIEAELRPWLSAWLAEQGLEIADVAGWAVHPGGPGVLAGVERALGLPHDALAESRAVLESYGNMSAPTLLFILERLQARGTAALPCVALAFGPGLTAEAALFDR